MVNLLICILYKVKKKKKNTIQIHPTKLGLGINNGILAVNDPLAPLAESR